MRWWLVLTGASLVVWLTAPPVLAAWQTTRLPHSDASLVDPITFGWTAAGGGLVGFTAQPPMRGNTVPVLAARVAPDFTGSPHTVRRLSLIQEGSPTGWLEPAGAGRMVFVGDRETLDKGELVWLQAGRVGSRLGRPRVVCRRCEVRRVVGGPNGEVAVAVALETRRPSARRQPVRVVVREADGRVRTVRVERIDRSAPSPAFAFNRRGDLLIAHDRLRRLPGRREAHRFAARLLPHRGRLGHAIALGRLTARSDFAGGSDLTVSLADDGRALVGWNVVPCDFITSCAPATLGLAVVGPSLHGVELHELARVPGFRFRDQREPRPLPGRVLVAAGEDGRSTIAWSAPTGPGDFAVMRAEVTGQSLGPAVAVSAPGARAHPAALASGPDGTTALLWTEAPPPLDPAFEPSRLLATVRSSAGTFEPPETVTDDLTAYPGDQRGFGDELPIGLAIAVPAIRPVAVWSAGSALVVGRR